MRNLAIGVTARCIYLWQGHPKVLIRIIFYISRLQSLAAWRCFGLGCLSIGRRFFVVVWQQTKFIPLHCVIVLTSTLGFGSQRQWNPVAWSKGKARRLRVITVNFSDVMFMDFVWFCGGLLICLYNCFLHFLLTLFRDAVVVLGMVFKIDDYNYNCEYNNCISIHIVINSLHPWYQHTPATWTLSCGLSLICRVEDYYYYHNCERFFLDQSQGVNEVPTECSTSRYKMIQAEVFKWVELTILGDLEAKTLVSPMADYGVGRLKNGCNKRHSTSTCTCHR